MWPSEVAFLEDRLGHTFDPALCEYLRLFGRLDKLPNSYDHPSNPYSWVYCSGPTSIVPIMLEVHSHRWLVVRIDGDGDALQVHELWESRRRLDRQPDRKETLSGIDLPFEQEMAVDAGSFTDMMSGDYIHYWARFEGLDPFGQGFDDDDIPF